VALQTTNLFSNLIPKVWPIFLTELTTLLTCCAGREELDQVECNCCDFWTTLTSGRAGLSREESGVFATAQAAPGSLCQDLDPPLPPSQFLSQHLKQRELCCMSMADLDQFRIRKW
jgi:hypothetical protein